MGSQCSLIKICNIQQLPQFFLTIIRNMRNNNKSVTTNQQQSIINKTKQGINNYVHNIYTNTIMYTVGSQTPSVAGS